MRLAEMDPRFTVMASRGPAEGEVLSALLSRFPRIPEEYVELCSEATEIELGFEDVYLRIWAPETCVDMDEGYGISAELEGAIPIGDDGGGRFLFYFDGRRGWGLYRVGYGDMDADDAVWVSASLRSLLGAAEGIVNL